MNLTAQRDEVLRAVARYAFLSTGQLYRVLHAAGEGDQRRVRAILTRFERAGSLVGRDSWVKERNLERGILRWEFTYFLTQAGRAMAEERDLDPEGLAHAVEEKSFATLGHEVGISEFILRLEEASGEPLWFRRFDLQHDFATGTGRRNVKPDLLFWFGGRYHFLECERSKQGNYRSGKSGLIRKCEDYLAYADRSLRPFQAKWPEMEGFFVRIVVGNPIRRDHLVEALRGSLPHALFRVASETEVRSDPLGTIWHDPRGGTSVLADPPLAGRLTPNQSDQAPALKRPHGS